MFYCTPWSLSEKAKANLNCSVHPSATFSKKYTLGEITILYLRNQFNIHPRRRNARDSTQDRDSPQPKLTRITKVSGASMGFHLS